MENFKSKEELDQMSYDEIMEHRKNIIERSKNTWKGSIEEEYINEVEFYTMLRFKEKEFEMYERWKEYEDENGKRGVDVIFSVGKDNEGVYRFRLSTTLAQIGGELNYIHGLEIPKDIIESSKEWKKATNMNKDSKS